MEAYAQALTYAIPGFILLIIIEHLISLRLGVQVNRAMDVISSLSSGMTNTLKSLMGLTVIILSYEWMVNHWAIFEIKSNLILYVLAFIGLDFAGYWSHRFNHEINVFWNRHIIHHSSEEFNLACALRQEVSAFIGIYFFLLIPMALIGIPAHVVAVVGPVHFFAQFWYHTSLIGRMGFLEYIIVTPSHHRVHHAINPEYIDKNYSEIFIIWDKLFGTFQEELPEVPPVYGVKKAVRTWNPFLINYMHIWQIVKDSWRTHNLWDKVRVWFMPTGWRPEDVKTKYPIEYTTDVYHREKYRTEASLAFVGWAWTQLFMMLILMYYILVRIADFAPMDIFGYAVFLMITIFGFTSAMDRHWLAVPAEGLKVLVGLFLVFKMDGWYGLDQYIPGATLIVVAYMFLSLLSTLYFLYMEKQVGKLSAV
ncbi:MAG: sterol desaturase family protein [Microscillaceae bacterium]|nr:sterol desaturase family protein [Microscillaceae bacterium]